jgi:hypothetical protein
MGRAGRVAFIGKIGNIHRIFIEDLQRDSSQEMDVDGWSYMYIMS